MITNHAPPVRKCRVCKRKYKSWAKTIMCCGKPARGLTSDAIERIHFVLEQNNRDTQMFYETYDEAAYVACAMGLIYGVKQHPDNRRNCYEVVKLK